MNSAVYNESDLEEDNEKQLKINELTLNLPRKSADIPSQYPANTH